MWAGLTLALWCMTPPLRAQQARGDSGGITLRSCPPGVQQAFRDAGGKILHIEKAPQKGGEVYIAEIRVKGESDEQVIVNGRGKVLRKAEHLSLSDCPSSVQHAVKERGHGLGVAEVTRITSDEGVSYEVSYKTANERVFQIEIGAGGKVLIAEEEIPFATCPEPVKRAMLSKAGGGKVDEVHRVTEGNGRVTYSAHLTSGKAEMEMDVSSEGKILDFHSGGQ